METDQAAGLSMQSRTLCRRVAEVCSAISFPEKHLADQLNSLVRALGEPLRVAFAGRVSMGKSTLVNALLRAPVAPTGDRETTRVVTRFENGDFELVELGLRDGTLRQAFLTPDGVLPPAYPVPTEEVREVTVRLPYAPLLRRVTLIDTPGLESVNEEASGRTTEALFSLDSRDAIARADALVYLMRTDSAADVTAISAFNELTSFDLCALNAVGVLNCKTEHPISDYDGTARRLKSEPSFRNRVADVIPVAGLLAFTAGSAMLNDCDAAELRTLAGYGDSLLIDVDEYLEAPCDVSREARQRLLDLLGFSGLHIALQVLRLNPGSLGDINDALLEQSGLPRLLDIIDGTFANCADQIKAGQTLAAVTRLSYQAETEIGHRARVMIETLRGDPAMHGIQELWALQQCALPDAQQPEWIIAELTQVAAGSTLNAKTGLPAGATAEQVLEAARNGAARAHSYAATLSMTRPEYRVAEILRRSYTNVYREAARAQ
jgi:Dynamin family